MRERHLALVGGGDLVGELDQRHGLELASPDNHGTFDEETADMVEWGYVG